jgi:predicted nucleotidyltransferase component of viral defense system
MDIGFGDELAEKPKKQSMRSVIPNTEPVSWLVYPLESMFAEKLQTLFRRGSGNSRARDVYDLGLLYARCSDRKALLAAIRRTFETRGTALPPSLLAEAKRFDLIILRSAWPSVELSDESATFDGQWASLLDILADLDKIR